MAKTIIVKDESTLDEMHVEIWDGTVLFSPGSQATLLLKKDEVQRLVNHLNKYLEESE